MDCNVESRLNAQELNYLPSYKEILQAETLKLSNSLSIFRFASGTTLDSIFEVITALRAEIIIQNIFEIFTIWRFFVVLRKSQAFHH